MSCTYNPEDGVIMEPSHPTEQEEIESIPQPPIHWFVKNLPEMNPNFPSSSIWRLADIYGPIFKLDVVTEEIVVVSSHELINEACNEDRFEKSINSALLEVRALLGDGLFTAFPEETVS
jgi:cytochrome P450/NADPH-cytochrome P450 reductase